MNPSRKGRISVRILNKVREFTKEDEVMNQFLEKILFKDPGLSKWYKEIYRDLLKEYSVRGMDIDKD